MNKIFDPKSFETNPIFDIESRLTSIMRVDSKATQVFNTTDVVMSGDVMHQIRRITVPFGTAIPKVKKTAKADIFIAALEADGERCVVCKDGKYVPINNSARAVANLVNNTDIVIEALDWTPYDVVRFLYGI